MPLIKKNNNPSLIKKPKFFTIVLLCMIIHMSYCQILKVQIISDIIFNFLPSPKEILN